MSVPARAIGGSHDESKHPRDEHGRWTDGSGTHIGGDPADDWTQTASGLNLPHEQAIKDRGNKITRVKVQGMWASYPTGQFIADLPLYEEHLNRNTTWQFMTTPKGIAVATFNSVYGTDDSNSRMEMHWLSAQDRGAGRAAMEMTVKGADKHGVTLQLYPVPLGATGGEGKKLTVAKLEKFYQEFGFKKKGKRDSDGYALFERKPVKAKQARTLGNGQWDEAEHPRADDGTFGSGPGRAREPKDEPAPKKKPGEHDDLHGKKSVDWKATASGLNTPGEQAISERGNYIRRNIAKSYYETARDRFQNELPHYSEYIKVDADHSYWQDFMTTPKGIAHVMLGGVYDKPDSKPTTEIKALLAVDRGAGRAALEMMTAAADKQGIYLQLDPVPLKSRGGLTMETDKLEAFYASFGFVQEGERDKGGTITMVRAPQAAKPSETFISPNVENLNFDQAKSELQSERTKMLAKASGEIDEALGLTDTSVRPAVGAWSDGAENSLIIRAKDANIDQMRASAAMKGWIADQKAVLIFQPKAGGDSFKATFKIGTSLDAAHAELLKAGLEFHTLEPNDDNQTLTIHVYGDSQKTLNAVGKIAGEYGAKADVTFGNGEFIGTTKSDGTDREQRDDARREYEKVINEISASRKLSGRDIGRIWNNVRARWGGPLSPTAPDVAAPIAAEFDHYNRRAVEREWLRRRTLGNGQWDEGEHPRADDGTFGSGPGNRKPAQPDAPAPKPAPPPVVPPGPNAPAAPAAAASEPKPKKKTKREDFADAGVGIVADSETTDEFIEKWDEIVGTSPADFMNNFAGGTKLRHFKITPSADNDSWEIRASIEDDGQVVGTMTRDIDFEGNSAKSSYFELDSSARGSDIGKQILAGNVETYRKMGLEHVEVYANLGVGGYAWAKYGYVPTQGSWDDIRASILNRLDGPNSGNRRSSSSNSYVPEEWSMLSEHDQSMIYDQWRDQSYDEFLQSSQESWLQNGEAKHIAKQQVRDSFNPAKVETDPLAQVPFDQPVAAAPGDWPEWAHDAVKSAREALRERDIEIPFTDKEILSSMKADYDDEDYEGSKDIEFSFDKEHFLQNPNVDLAPAFDPNQMTFPIIDPLRPEQALTDEMRDELVGWMRDNAHKEADNQESRVTPPDYLSDNAREDQATHWEENLDDDDRYRIAERNGWLPEIESEEEEEPQLALDNVPEDETALLKRVAENRDPKGLWAIADSKRGKDLLLGTSWNGVLDLKDKETMDRFKSYVNKSSRMKKEAA